MLEQKKLKKLEGDFLMRYPKGFLDPEIEAIGKKHRMGKMVELAHDSFSEQACSNVHVTAENMIKVVSRSSMVSLFEKPKFRDFVRSMDENEKAFLVQALSQMLHGKQQLGFEAMVDILKTQKLAKWSLITIIPAYYRPTKEVFVKPTTAKNILRHFDIADPVYKPTPSWDFYKKYRKLINDSKKAVDKSLSPSNAAFSGFLMMTVS
ncbi:hypothetical protein [Oceanicoccus sp. KOV_DT_Chl]|uniref:hypothetical protein n=1 Tax=Oceanicoccus sp. KOV_DT_Chl TaxID=1904639 RepID=UPI000C797CDD|nr:hypothetical protein [Oceanicoccus sp. KOV_DT_Chl]